MKRRGTALLLALALCICGILPVRAQAAQKEPLVLQTRKEGSTVYHYYYDREGRCVYEEFANSYNQRQISYTYNMNGALVEKFSYRGEDLVEAAFYDDSGNLTDRYCYSKGRNGEVYETAYRGTPEYDIYGRLVMHTVTGPYDGTELEDHYEVESHRYEYYDAPESILFGHYEQDGNTANGAEPIEWLVLDADGQQLLLLSKYALDSRVYHSQNTDVRWEDCDLREWLNEEFAEKAFTEEELYQIRSTQVGQKAYDTVTVLSMEDVHHYFPQAEERICTATKYAVKKGAYVNSKTKGSWWLLRNQGWDSQCAMSVNSDGSMDYDGGKVASKKGTVRPAIWVSVTAMAGKTTPAREHYHYTSYEKSSREPIATWASLLTYNDRGVVTYEQIQDNDSEGYFNSRNNSYDDFGNLESCEIYVEYPDNVGSEAGLYLYENTLDKAGRVTKQVERDAATGEVLRTVQFRYDKAGRMLSRKDSYGEETWKYDSQGNLLQRTENGKVQESCTYVSLSKALWKYA